MSGRRELSTQRRDLEVICAISKDKHGDRTTLRCDCGWSWVGHFMLAGPAQFGHMKEHVNASK